METSTSISNSTSSSSSSSSSSASLFNSRNNFVTYDHIKQIEWKITTKDEKHQQLLKQSIDKVIEHVNQHDTNDSVTTYSPLSPTSTSTSSASSSSAPSPRLPTDWLLPSQQFHVIDSFLSPHECHTLMSLTREKESLIGEYVANERDARRVLVWSQNLASMCWERLEKIIQTIYRKQTSPNTPHSPYYSSSFVFRPMGFGCSGMWLPHCVNPCMRVSEYTNESNGFVVHRDSASVLSNGCRSIWSLIIYLNTPAQQATNDGQVIIHTNNNDSNSNNNSPSIPLLCDGSTTFYSSVGFIAVSPTITVPCVEGRALLFNHELLHSAHPLHKQLCHTSKIILRTDIMFRRCTHIPLTKLELNWRFDKQFIQCIQLFQLGFAYELAGKVKEASECYEKSLSLRVAPLFKHFAHLQQLQSQHRYQSSHMHAQPASSYNSTSTSYNAAAAPPSLFSSLIHQAKKKANSFLSANHSDNQQQSASASTLSASLSSPFTFLLPDLLRTIFTYLHLNDAHCANQVCHAWYQIQIPDNIHPLHLHRNLSSMIAPFQSSQMPFERIQHSYRSIVPRLLSRDGINFTMSFPNKFFKKYEQQCRRVMAMYAIILFSHATTTTSNNQTQKTEQPNTTTTVTTEKEKSAESVSSSTKTSSTTSGTTSSSSSVSASVSFALSQIPSVSPTSISGLNYVFNPQQPYILRFHSLTGAALVTTFDEILKAVFYGRHVKVQYKTNIRNGANDNKVDLSTSSASVYLYPYAHSAHRLDTPISDFCSKPRWCVRLSSNLSAPFFHAGSACCGPTMYSKRHAPNCWTLWDEVLVPKKDKRKIHSLQQQQRNASELRILDQHYIAPNLMEHADKDTMMEESAQLPPAHSQQQHSDHNNATTSSSSSSSSSIVISSTAPSTASSVSPLLTPSTIATLKNRYIRSLIKELQTYVPAAAAIQPPQHQPAIPHYQHQILRKHLLQILDQCNQQQKQHALAIVEKKYTNKIFNSASGSIPLFPSSSSSSFSGDPVSNQITHPSSRCHLVSIQLIRSPTNRQDQKVFKVTYIGVPVL